MKKLNERFTDAADWVSNAMGTPLNILLWFAAVVGWFLLFALNPGLQNSSFMPSWFTSLPFNLPLNLITTLAELFIGFLVAAAANRVERHNRELQETQLHLLQQTEQLEERVSIQVTEAHTDHSAQLAQLQQLVQQALDKSPPPPLSS